VAASGRACDLGRLADHGAVPDVDVPVTVGRGRVEDGDIDGRDAIAQPVALDADQLLPGAGDARPRPHPRVDERADPRRREERVLTAAEPVDQQRHRALRKALQLTRVGGREVEHGAKGLEVAGDEASTEPALAELLGVMKRGFSGTGLG
jgi:hypothetical protein